MNPLRQMQLPPRARHAEFAHTENKKLCEAAGATSEVPAINDGTNTNARARAANTLPQRHSFFTFIRDSFPS
jgi:hypothetical protein